MVFKFPYHKFYVRIKTVLCKTSEYTFYPVLPVIHCTWYSLYNGIMSQCDTINPTFRTILNNIPVYVVFSCVHIWFKILKFSATIRGFEIREYFPKFRYLKFKSLEIRDLKIESQNLRFESRNFFCWNSN